MTLLDKMKMKEQTNADGQNQQSSDKSQFTNVENGFKDVLAEFKTNTGFSINTNQPPSDTVIEVLSSKNVMVSITLLLAYIRYCVNNGVKKDITLKIGYNKPPDMPMNFAINDEMLEDIYPGDTIEIN